MGNEIGISIQNYPEQDMSVRVGLYNHFITVDIAFGQVRHLPVPNRLPFGEKGIVSASRWFGPPGVGGQAIPGYDLPEPKWRIGAVAPKSRTAVHPFPDGYHQTDDIIGFLASLRPLVTDAVGSEMDPTIRSWAYTEKGW